jgi:cytosine/adenosine deaminase-related metal-dependent hydrolase
MILNNVQIIGGEDNISQIKITGSKIDSVNKGNKFTLNSSNESVFEFTDAIAFPGLINSHDHLEFNLFPKLGNKFYNDYVEWGNDIHSLNKEQIEQIQKIPYELRFKWGLYKNLLCGVTTVAHHGNGQIFNYSRMPGIISDYNYLHSVRLEKNWKRKLNFSFNSNPSVLHLGEGKNSESFDEINELLRWNLFRKKIIGVHGISLKQSQSCKLTALVWCPDSNLFLYNKTANITSLKQNTNILFGTDSTLSADWNLWNHLRLARKLNYLTDEELYNSVTKNPASVWGISSTGLIDENKIADIVVSRKKISNEPDSIFNTNPEDIWLILKNGQIILIDKNIADNQNVLDKNKFDMVTINSADKLVTKGIQKLKNSINNFNPDYKFPVEIN